MPEITVRPSSRYPAYDSGHAHAYDSRYVRPRNWAVTLDVSKGLPKRRLTLPPAPPLNKPVTIEVPISPQGLRSYKWIMQHSSGATHELLVEGQEGMVPTHATIEVATPGHYSISLIETYAGGSQKVTTRPYSFEDKLVLCLGDSFASGQGNPTRGGRPTWRGGVRCWRTAVTIAREQGIPMARRPEWVEPEAYRSYESGHARAARGSESLATGRLITFLSFATSGAEVVKGLLEPQHPWQSAGQIDEAATALSGRHVDALLLSVGGNDVGFGPALKKLAGDWLDGGQAQMVHNVERRLAGLPRNLRQLAGEIKDKLSPAHVLATEYPRAFFDSGYNADERTDGCGVFETLFFFEVSKSDADHIYRLSGILNATIEQAARDHGWTYVDGVADRFAGHGYCSDDSFFVGAEQSCRSQGDFEGTMHPNAKGHDAYYAAIFPILHKRLNWTATG